MWFWGYLPLQQLPAPYSPECSSNSSDFARQHSAVTSNGDVAHEGTSDATLESSVQNIPNSATNGNEDTKGKFNVTFKSYNLQL